MTFPASFKDQGKNANDLLGKGFPSSDKFNWKVELDTTSENNVQFIHSLSHGPKGIDGELRTKFKAHDFNFTVTGNQKEDISLELSHAKALNGLKPTLTLSSNTASLFEKFQLKISGEMRKDWLFASTSIDLPQKEAPQGETTKEAVVTPNFVVSTVLGSKSNGLSAGFDLQFDTSAKDLKNFNSVLSYTSSDLEVSLFCKTKPFQKSAEFGATYYQKLITRWKDAAVAGQLAYPMRLTSPRPSFAIGGFFKPDPTSSVKGRINEKGYAGLSYTQQWGGPFSVTLSSEVNLLDLQEPALFGVKLSIK